MERKRSLVYELSDINVLELEWGFCEPDLQDARGRVDERGRQAEPPTRSMWQPRRRLHRMLNSIGSRCALSIATFANFSFAPPAL